jgi:hypothetical protein
LIPDEAIGACKGCILIEKRLVGTGKNASWLIAFALIRLKNNGKINFFMLPLFNHNSKDN